jgi:hypothetical protein
VQRMAEPTPGSSNEVPAPVSTATSPAQRTRRRPQWIYLVVVVVVVVIAILLVLMPGGLLRPASTGSSTDTTTLAQSGWNSNSLPYGQFADISFVAKSTSAINGSFLTVNTIQAYVMNDSDFRTLAIKDVVAGYQWTSGDVWSGWINDTVSAGSWNLVFVNQDYYTSSGVAASSPITLTPV